MKKIVTFFIVLTFFIYKNQAQTVTDIDGNIYDTIIIGSQIWMKENLKTSKYNDGASIAYPGTNNSGWSYNNTGAYACYDNDTQSYKNVYGFLYNGYAVDATANGGRNICPLGWHVPTDHEWNIMEKYLDNTVDTTGKYWVGIDIGGKLKEAGTIHWMTPNTGANNSSGFTALPGGYRGGGEYHSITSFGFWWTATDSTNTIAWYRSLGDNTSKIERNNVVKLVGASVRCVCDTLFVTDTLIDKVNEYYYQNKIQIYPNPATEYLIIETHQKATIEISNIQGQLIKTLAVNNTTTNVDVSILPRGVYVLHVKNENGVAVRKFVVK